jgi:hypothetical protein
MGAQPYWYFTKYRPSIDTALGELKQREFKAGRYNPVMRFISFPVENTPSAEPEHASIKEAIADAGMDGTRSILDIERVGDVPDFGVAVPLDDGELGELYGTTKPTHEMIELNMDFFEQIERGQAIYITVFTNDHPDELFFAGYSYD